MRTCTREINLVNVLIAERLISTEASTLNKRISAGRSRCICSSKVPVVPTNTNLGSSKVAHIFNHKQDAVELAKYIKNKQHRPPNTSRV